MRTRKLALTVAAAAAVALALTAGSCDTKGTCHPGDVKGAHGHVEKCGPDQKWHV